MHTTRGWVAVGLALALVAAGCDDGGDGEAADGEGTPTTEQEVAEQDGPQLTPEELADKYRVPVPEGMTLVSATEDVEAGTARFEIAYEGPPDVDGYREAIVAEGWDVASEGPLESFAWCLDLLGFVAYVVLASGVITWEVVVAAATACVLGAGLSLAD